ncbi:MAG TPA: beta-ketoacyl-ACP synthase III [Thermoanaerobaculia bacterium]|nr:beta-ketoacyl-ACP synthase III [Thermoanaerobaculia bacterium]
MASIITGTGIGIPKNVVPNAALTRIMDTTDEWIRTRSGVEQRHYVDDGQGSSDLGVMAATAALDSAGRTKDEIDAIIFATMTPDHFFPGNGPVLQAKMGFPESVPAFDIRQQCSGFLYGLDLADSLIRSGKYGRVLLVGADVHSPFMPWQNGWATTIGQEEREVTPEEYAANTALRDRVVLFGDGAGAVVLEASDNGSGILATRLFTNGGNIEALYVPGVGFRRRPYVTHDQIDTSEIIPVMEGREVFKEAVSRMPASVRAVCEAAGVDVAEIDLLLVHQANLRIIEAVAKQLGLPKEKVPHNIDRYGNTTAGTLPILFHEMREAGRIVPGSLICFTALGAGLHWGAALYRA